MEKSPRTRSGSGEGNGNLLIAYPQDRAEFKQWISKIPLDGAFAGKLLKVLGKRQRSDLAEEVFGRLTALGVKDKVVDAIRSEFLKIVAKHKGPTDSPNPHPACGRGSSAIVVEEFDIDTDETGHASGY